MRMQRSYGFISLALLLGLVAVLLLPGCIDFSDDAPNLHISGDDPTVLAHTFASGIVAYENSKAGTQAWALTRVVETSGTSGFEPPTGSEERTYQVFAFGRPPRSTASSSTEVVDVGIVRRIGTREWRVKQWGESAVWGEE